MSREVNVKDMSPNGEEKRPIFLLFDKENR